MLFLKFPASLKQYRQAIERSPWSVEARPEACASDRSPQTARPDFGHFDVDTKLYLFVKIYTFRNALVVWCTDLQQLIIFIQIALATRHI